jgi:hypothetical protein
MRQAALMTAFALLAGAPSTLAHHGYPDFHDPSERTVAVEGVLEALRFVDPHVTLTIRTADDVLYEVAWQAPAWIEAVTGATADTFRSGDRLVVVGAPALDPARRDVTLVREVRRPADGWRWVSQVPFAPPS